MSAQVPHRTPAVGDNLRILLRNVLPPDGVLQHLGFGMHFKINFPLTLPGDLSGIVHAAWIIATRQVARSPLDVQKGGHHETLERLSDSAHRL